MRLIDADELNEYIGRESLDTREKIFALVDRMPTVEERPHGEWIKGREISRTMLCDKTLHIDYENFTCSVCGLVLDRLLYHVDGSPFYNFCPNCGSKMLDKRQEGE